VKATVVDNVQRHHYEVVHDGALAGFAAYRLETFVGADQQPRDVIAFTHTEIDEPFAGLGLASTLIKHALEDSRSKGLAVLPYCPFVRGYIAKHPEYQDLVPEGWAP
jgi:hypothetical protein